MASSRGYVPSMAVLRSLSRSRPFRCPFAQPLRRQFTRPVRCPSTRPFLPVTFSRSESTTSIPSTETSNQPMSPQDFEKTLEKALQISPEFKQVWEEAQIEMKETAEEDDFTELEYVQQDLKGQFAEQVIQIVKTREDLDRLEQTVEMIRQSDAGPDPHHPSRALRRVLVDSLMANPNFAQFHDVLEDMRDETLTKEEIEAMMADMTDEERAEYNDEVAADHMEYQNDLQKTIDHPNCVPEIKEALINLRDNWTDWREWNSDEFRNELLRIERLAYAHPLFQQNLQRYKELGGEHAQYAKLMEFENIMRENPNAIFDPDDDYETTMKKIYEWTGETPELDAEIAELVKEEGTAVTSNPEYDPTPELEVMLERITKFKDALPEEEADRLMEDPKHIAELDKLMDLPQFPQFISLFKECLDEVYAEQNDLTKMIQPSAPDPSTWDKSTLVTFAERIKMADSDPEHVRAIRKLQVKLLPPFNVSPAVRHFNQAIKLAYVGASDDVRRILWRCYTRARLVPTFLQNISDDAWDIIWYSQAVNWRSNQNRSSHLTILLKDLEAVGKDGPPTDPRTLDPEML